MKKHCMQTMAEPLVWPPPRLLQVPLPTPTRSSSLLIRGSGCGRAQEAAWNLPGSCMEAAWKLHGSCVEASWKLHGICLEAAWKMRAARHDHRHGGCGDRGRAVEALVASPSRRFELGGTAGTRPGGERGGSPPHSDVDSGEEGRALADFDQRLASARRLAAARERVKAEERHGG
jgi:hypothetical protein